MILYGLYDCFVPTSPNTDILGKTWEVSSQGLSSLGFDRTGIDPRGIDLTGN